METINQSIFLWLNAPAHPDSLVLALAIFFANWLVWLMPALLVIGWLRGCQRTRKIMIMAAMAMLAGLLINQIISLLWSHPRPFMIGLGHTYIYHDAETSFPSDHLTLWWAAALSILLQPDAKKLGLVLTLLGLPIAWARIYLGVHFPIDMLGAAIVALFCAWLALRIQTFYLQPLYQLASYIHCRIFGPLIKRGWVRE